MDKYAAPSTTDSTWYVLAVKSSAGSGPPSADTEAPWQSFRRQHHSAMLADQHTSQVRAPTVQSKHGDVVRCVTVVTLGTILAVVLGTIPAVVLSTVLAVVLGAVLAVTSLFPILDAVLTVARRPLVRGVACGTPAPEALIPAAPAAFISGPTSLPTLHASQAIEGLWH